MVRTALVDAASVSSLMMTSEAIVVESPEDKKAGAVPPAAWAAWAATATCTEQDSPAASKATGPGSAVAPAFCASLSLPDCVPLQHILLDAAQPLADILC